MLTSGDICIKQSWILKRILKGYEEMETCHFSCDEQLLLSAHGPCIDTEAVINLLSALE